MRSIAHLRNIFLIVSILLSFPAIQANLSSIPKDPCLIKWHVDSEPLVLDLASYPTECSLQFTTNREQLFAISYIDGDLSNLASMIKIRDGANPHASVIEFERENPSNQFNLNQRQVIYTTGSSAVIEITKKIQMKTHLKIQRAVSCPFNLGPSSQCGRVVDVVSCYCAVYANRTWQDQNAFCQEKGFQLLSIESQEEENAIYAAWGKATYFWTSLTDSEQENVFVWSSTGVRLNPGYVNWHANQPDGFVTCNTPDHDCVHLNYLNGGWNDAPCTMALEAICESQPV